MRKKKLLFVINTMGRAGAEMALVNLLKKLDSMKTYELFLYSIIPCGELFEQLPKNVHILNKRISNSPLLSFFGRLRIAQALLASFFYKLTGFRLLPYMIKNVKDHEIGRAHV